MTLTATYSPEDNKLRLYASTRLDEETYKRVKAAGFKWAPRQDLFVAPTWTPERADLLTELCGEIGDEDTSLVDRQEQRAERFEEYSDHRKEDAASAHAAVNRIADGIPLGQPILVGHHSERHARKDAEKIENGMRKAVKMWETAQYWKWRAEGAIAHAKYKERPDVRARRIKGLESDIRVYRSRFTPVEGCKPIMQTRWSDHDKPAAERVEVPHVFCAPRGGRGGSWVPVSSLPALERHYTRWIEHCENRLVYERAMLEESGALDLLKPKPRPTQLPLCNYRAPSGLQISRFDGQNKPEVYPQVDMTQAEYARINVDYKGTRRVGNSHRVRIAMVKHALVLVFLTDSKVHTPPEAVEPAPREPKFPVTLTQAPKREEDPQAADFEAMKESLKAGVKVVSAPQLFSTPPDVARRMADLAGCLAGLRVLEPSAGTGNLIRAAINNATGLDCGLRIVAVERNFSLAEGLREQRLKTLYATEANFDVRCTDFLECNGDLGKFDRVLMNPPFEHGSDIKHIQHALTFLKPGGLLVAICANGPRQNATLQPLSTEWEELPEGTFTGTGVRAVLLTIESEPEAEQGYDESKDEPEPREELFSLQGEEMPAQQISLFGSGE